MDSDSPRSRRTFTAELLHPDRTEGVCTFDSTMSELQFLLPVEQTLLLDRMAEFHGITVGQLLRRIVRGSFEMNNPSAADRIDDVSLPSSPTDTKL